jgi:hypothetical protein
MLGKDSDNHYLVSAPPSCVLKGYPHDSDGYAPDYMLDGK